MGCISSKAITRSLSIREELSHGFQSRSAVWEELLSSHSANDQLFAFVCSDTTKLKTSSFTLPSHTPPSTKHLVDAWDLINAKPDPQNDSFKFTRSKSCHTVSESRSGLKDKSVAGSRSFHTVEEYDALLERIRGTRSLECFDDCFPWDEDDVTELQAGEDENEEDCSSVKSGENCEAGWKRKAVARGLKSLDISAPATGIARMKQRMAVQGQIYSPGTYETPKFGSYNDPAVREARHKENAVFSPELVAAFEDCMQHLQVEEDSILRHMDDHVLIGG